MTQNEYDKWYRELNEAQKEATDEFFAWKEKASKGKDCYADIGITRINGKAEVALREGEYISPFRGFQMSLKQNGRILSSCNWRCEDADEKNFYAAWKEAAAEKIAEKNQGNNAEDLVRITFEQMVDFYKKIYPDSTLINTEKGILESIDSASSEMEEAKTSDLGYSVEDAELYEGKFYIYKRMETHYDDTLLGSLQKELDSFNTSKAIEWLAYDVDYLMGEAYPGETAYVLITEDEYTFSKQAAYKLTYVDTGKTTELVDDQGFRWEASVYFVVDEDTYNENLQKMFRAEQALYDTYERILNNFGLAE